MGKNGFVSEREKNTVSCGEFRAGETVAEVGGEGAECDEEEERAR